MGISVKKIIVVLALLGKCG